MSTQQTTQNQTTQQGTYQSMRYGKRQSNSKLPKYYSSPPIKTITSLSVEEEQELEKERYDYYRLKNKGKYKTAKHICQHSYAKFDTNYLGDEMDSILINGKMLEECDATDKQKYIRSYEHMYANVDKIIIELTILGTQVNKEFTGSEARHILENLKLPDYTKLHKQSYTDYFKSFIFSNVIPQSHQEPTDFTNIKITNIWIHTNDTIMNFYLTKSQRCEYKYVVV
jgi:hypothetical protein